ncbi:MAG: RidA family protein [Microthrixaceae bacterium]
MSSPPYSPVYRAGDWCCVSGQIGLGPDGLADSFGEQLDQVLVNLGALLDQHDLRRDQVAKTTVFLVDMADYAELNERYLDFFGDHRPARSAVAVAGLPFAARVEIEAWVHTGGA